MIQLKKGQTLKEFWAQRNGLRMKLLKMTESLEMDNIENMLTMKEKNYIRDINLLANKVIFDWNGNKTVINRGLEVNAK